MRIDVSSLFEDAEVRMQSFRESLFNCADQEKARGFSEEKTRSGIGRPAEKASTQLFEISSLKAFIAVCSIPIRAEKLLET